MARKGLLVLALAIVVSLFVGVFAASAADKPELIGVTIINKSDSNVFISLIPEDGTKAYFLVAPKDDVADAEEDRDVGTTSYFTVPPGKYTHTTVDCGNTGTGTVDLSHFTTLVFTDCGAPPQFPGEPGIEKILIPDAPDRTDYRFQLK